MVLFVVSSLWNAQEMHNDLLPRSSFSSHKRTSSSPQKSTFLIKVEFDFQIGWQSSSDELPLLSLPKSIVDWIIVTSFTVVYWLSVSDTYNKAINISYSTNMKANLRLYKDIRYTPKYTTLWCWITLLVFQNFSKHNALFANTVQKTPTQLTIFKVFVPFTGLFELINYLAP